MCSSDLEAVLRGIDRTFEKYDQRKGKTRRVNGLAYCHQGVLEAAQEIERGELPHESAPPPFPHEALAAYLEKNTAAVNRFADKLTALGRAESAGDVRAIANSMQEQAALVLQQQSADLQTLEQRMSLLEEKIYGLLKQTTEEETLLQIRTERDRQMAPFRSKMNAEQLRQLEAQLAMRKLFELAELPRLSLFYL